MICFCCKLNTENNIYNLGESGQGFKIAMQILDAGKTGFVAKLLFIWGMLMSVRPTVIPISKDSKEGNDIGL